MNIKERGITVGDLMILILIIITTLIVFKNLNKNKKTTFNISSQTIIPNSMLLISTK